MIFQIDVRICAVAGKLDGLTCGAKHMMRMIRALRIDHFLFFENFAGEVIGKGHLDS